MRVLAVKGTFRLINYRFKYLETYPVALYEATLLYVIFK